MRNLIEIPIHCPALHLDVQFLYVGHKIKNIKQTLAIATNFLHLSIFIHLVLTLNAYIRVQLQFASQRVLNGAHQCHYQIHLMLNLLHYVYNFFKKNIAAAAVSMSIRIMKRARENNKNEIL